MDLVDDLREIEGVRYVKRRSSGVLKMKLFSREIPGSEAEEIRGDLRTVSQNISSALDGAVTNGEIKGWNWVEKPQKQYRDKSPSGMNVSDRQGAGHKPTHYTVSVKREQE